MEKNAGLSFDATITAKDAKDNLKVPVIRKKANTKTNIKEINPNIESSLNSEIRVSDLVIDMSYQRFPNEDKVNNIVKNFNQDALGVLICSIREDGTIAVIDGGHRVAALRMMNLENSTVDCLVYFGLTIAEEAKIFNLMNDNRTKPKTHDLFKAKVTAQDPEAVAINAILEKHNLQMTNRPTNNAVRAAGTLSKLFKKNGAKNIDNTIDILKTAFDSHSSTLSDAALTAISNILAIYPEVDKARLIKALKLQVNSNLWASNGANISKQIKASDRSIGMSIVLIKDYNKKMKTNRLDEKKMW
jgi:hypothetical protein